MPRPTSSGFHYLTVRSDSGKYAYWRTLNAGIAAYVVGDIRLSWAVSSPLARGLRQALKQRQSGPPLPEGLRVFLDRFPDGLSDDEIRAAAREMEADTVRESLKAGSLLRQPLPKPSQTHCRCDSRILDSLM